jgi:hypothetical protein
MSFGRGFLDQTACTDSLPKDVAEFRPEKIRDNQFNLPFGVAAEERKCFLL